MLKRACVGLALAAAGCDLAAPVVSDVRVEPRVERARKSEALAPLACDFPAVLLPEQRLEVAAPADGYLELGSIDLGSSVAGSEVLFVVRDDAVAPRRLEANADVAQARSTMRRARLAVQQRRQDRRVVQTLGAWAAPEELRAVDNEFGSAQAELDKAQAGVASARARATRIRHEAGVRTVTAPFSGRVTARHADEGAFVTVGTPILRFVRGGEGRIRFAAPERDALRIAAGQTIRWTTLDGRRGAGTITRAAAEAEATSELVVFEARADGGGDVLAELPAGASLYVSIRADSSKGRNPSEEG